MKSRHSNPASKITLTEVREAHNQAGHDEALYGRNNLQASRSLGKFYELKTAYEMQSGKEYVPGAPRRIKTIRRANPVPPSSRVIDRKVARGSKLYSDFTGHEAEIVARVDKPVAPDVLIAIGECDGLMYTTVRDGKTERYIHEFAKKSRPLFCVTDDGKMLYLLG